MFDEQVNEKGIVFPSEESKIASLNDFIRQAEDGVDEPEVNVIDSTLKVDQRTISLFILIARRLSCRK